MIIFNRPDKTKILFEQIKKIKPKKLYVAADGPRNEKDLKAVEQTRSIIKVDWDCDVHYLYQEKNLGVALNPSNAMTKMFSENEYGIILEDDIYPDLSFFPFMEEILIRYKDDERFGFVSGMNPVEIKNGDSYTFVRYGYSYGWATWKRVWDKYDFEIKSWGKLRKTDWLKKKLKGVFIRMHWNEYFNRVLGGSNDAWDYQFMYTIISNNLLAIVPKYNISKNIGFDAEATHHTSGKVPKKFVNCKALDFPLQHPDEVKINIKTEKVISKKWRKLMFIKLFSRPFKYIPMFFRFLF